MAKTTAPADKVAEAPAATDKAEAPKAAAIEATSTTTEQPSNKPLRIGQSVMVVCPEGRVLINNQTGTKFVPGQATQQTVTAALIRRVKDGDLRLA